jgi:hypothetical protein
LILGFRATAEASGRRPTPAPGRNAKPPLLPDPRKQHCQRGFVSRWIGLLHAARHMSMCHVDRGTSPCCLRPRSSASHRQSRRRTSDPPPLDQHPCSREITSPQPPAKASDTTRNRSRQIWRTARRPSCRSEGSTNTRCHQLWDTAVKVDVDVGVKLRQIYLPRRCSHHPNNAP